MNPVFYSLTIGLLLNLTLRTAWGLICQYQVLAFEASDSQYAVYAKRLTSAINTEIPHSHTLKWIAKYIQRKEGSQDDADDQHVLSTCR